MSKLECEVVRVTGDHDAIWLESAPLIPCGLGLDEIKHRIVQAYMRLVFWSDKTSGSRTVSVSRSNLLEVQITEMPPEILMLGLPSFMLEIFSLPSHSSVDSFGFFDLDDTELAAAATFVLGATRDADDKAAAALN